MFMTHPWACWKVLSPPAVSSAPGGPHSDKKKSLKSFEDITFSDKIQKTGFLVLAF